LQLYFTSGRSHRSSSCLATAALAAGWAVCPQPAMAQAVLADQSALDARVTHALDFTSPKLMAKVLNVGTAFHWIDGGERFWYRKALDSARVVYLLVDASTGQQTPLFDDKTMAAMAVAGAPRLFLARNPRHRREVFEGVGHFPHLEAPDSLGEVLTEHLQLSS